MYEQIESQPKNIQRVNINDDIDVKYWTKKFGCTTNQLKMAVEKVGVMVRVIEKELKAK
jgi:hypothetical protein